MSCDLVTSWGNLRYRASKYPGFAAPTRCVGRDRRLRWRLATGGYLLYIGFGTIDFDLPIGVALAGAKSIDEQLMRRLFMLGGGVMDYAIRSFGPLGVEDDAATPDRATLRMVSGNVQPPEPPHPLLLSVVAAQGGQILVTVHVNNVGAEVPAAWLEIYTDGGSGGGVPWLAPLGSAEPVHSGVGHYRLLRDPGVVHGTTVEVGVRTKSADGVVSGNTDTQTVVIDSVGPPAITDFTVGCV